MHILKSSKILSSSRAPGCSQLAPGGPARYCSLGRKKQAQNQRPRDMDSGDTAISRVGKLQSLVRTVVTWGIGHRKNDLDFNSYNPDRHSVWWYLPGSNGILLLFGDSKREDQSKRHSRKYSTTIDCYRRRSRCFQNVAGETSTT